MKPITALRRLDMDLSLLRIEVRSQAQSLAELSVGVNSCRRDLNALVERIAGAPKRGKNAGRLAENRE